MKRISPDDLKVCNCAGCGKELAGALEATSLAELRRHGWHACLPDEIAVRRDGRPWCDGCLPGRGPGGGPSVDATREPKGRRPMHHPEEFEPSPWQENAVRLLEEPFEHQEEDERW